MARALLLKRSSPFAYPGGTPGFDPSHPAAGTTRGAFAADGVIYTDLLRGIPVKIGAGTRVNGPQATIGPSCNFAAGWTAAQIGNPTIQDTAFTFATIFTPISLVANSFYFCTDGNSGTAGLQFGCVSSGNPAVAPSGGSSWGGMGAVIAGVPYFWAVSGQWNGSTGFNWTGVLRRLDNGQFAGKVSGFATTTLPAVNDGRYVIGNQNIATNFKQARANIATVMYAAQFHDLPTLVKWSDDPWSFWYPRTLDLSMMLTAPAGGGGGGFIPAWAMNSNLPVLGTGTY